MPELDDDIDPVEPVAAAAISEAEPDAEAPVSAEPARAKYDPREEAVRRYRERRNAAAEAAQDESEAEIVEAAPEDEGEPEVEDAPEDEGKPRAPAEAAPKSAPAEAEEPMFTLLVDGKPVQMKQSEVLATAQKNLAADNRLEEAKSLLKEARTLRGQASPDQQHQQSDDDADLSGNDDQPPVKDAAPANQQKPALDPEKLRAIVQRLQVGDEDEGVEALTEALSLVAAQPSKPQVTTEEIGRVITQTKIQDELKTAAQTFQTSQTAIMEDPDLTELSFGRIRSEVRNDLKSLGVDDRRLASMTGDQLFALHMEARLKGANVRDYNAIFGKVGKDMTERFAPVLKKADPAPAPTAKPQTPDNAPRIAERVERKRAALQQPRTAGGRQAPTPPKQARSRQDIVAEMRRQRGFTA